MFYCRCRLNMPSLSYSGAACVEFHYHMFGFHVRTLRLVHRSSSVGGDVTAWEKSGQRGNTWHRANTEINLSRDSQVYVMC